MHWTLEKWVSVKLFDRSQIVMVRRVNQSISKTVGIVGCSWSAVVKTIREKGQRCQRFTDMSEERRLASLDQPHKFLWYNNGLNNNSETIIFLEHLTLLNISHICACTSFTHAIMNKNSSYFKLHIECTKHVLWINPLYWACSEHLHFLVWKTYPWVSAL